MSETAGSQSGLLRTPLYGEHAALGARMAPFGGWEMPIDYGSVLTEHRATRTAAGLFDLSHMGEFLVTGPGALALVSTLITNDPSLLAPGQCQYSPMCRDDGTIVDDVIVYHLPDGLPGRYLIVVNAANIARDWAWVRSVRDDAGLQGAVALEDSSAETALIAVQGPGAAPLLQRLVDVDLSIMPSFAIARIEIAGVSALAARTGYTGEDGFELFMSPDDASPLWRALLERGAPSGLHPVGLGARDTLRLEARLPLYGNDISDATTPLEAGLSRFVKLDKPAFRGRDALVAQRDSGPLRRLIGLAMADRSVPRAHYPVLSGAGERIGEVTSGGFSPTLAHGIALAYVPVREGTVGATLQIDIRGRLHPATVVKTPFYRRAK